MNSRIFDLRVLLFSTLSIITSLSAWSLPAHKFTQYTSEDGLEENVVQYIMQDRSGLMWFATWDGLYSFDGFRFTRHGAGAHGASPSNMRMDQLSEDLDGNLWMLAYNGVVYRYNQQENVYQQITDDNYRVTDVMIMSDGKPWMVTSQAELLTTERDSVTGDMQIRDFFTSHQLRKPSRINHLTIDSRGHHWIMTENGVYRYRPQTDEVSIVSPLSGYSMVEHAGKYYIGSRDGNLLQMTDNDRTASVYPLETTSSLKILQPLSAGNIAVVTASDGFFLLNLDDLSRKHLTTQQCRELGSNRMHDLYVDYKGEMWLRTDQPGVVHYVPQTGACRRFLLYDFENQPIDESRMDQIVVEDINHHLWIHPSGGGLAWYNRQTDELEPFYNPNLQNRWSNANKLTAMFSDVQGNLWFGSYGNGLEKASFSLFPFTLMSHNPKALDFGGNNVRAVLQDRDGYIWAGGKDQVIRVYDAQYNYLGSLCHDGTISPQRQESVGQAYCMMQSADGIVWIGTKGNGLLVLCPTARQQAGQPLRYTLHQYTSDEENIYSLSSNEVYSLYEDHNGRIWVATFQNGVNIMQRGVDGLPSRFFSTRNQLTAYPLIPCYRARYVTGDNQGNIWIGTTGGLLVTTEDFIQPSQLVFRRYHRQKDNPQSLSCDDVHGIYRTRDGRRFVCTFGGGLSELHLQPDGTATFERVNQHEGRQSGNVLLSMQEDRNGHLWCAAEDGLSCLDLQTGSFTNYRSRLFPIRFSINEGQALALQNGELLYNTTRGLLHFYPDSIRSSDFVPPIRFERDSILLQPEQHTFVAQFAALDYVLPEAIHYAYRLRGFEEEWHFVGAQHSATYTNLPPGQYLLEVRSTDSGGFWSDNTQSLPVEVMPTFGETALADVLRVLAVLLILAAIIVIALVIYRLKHKMQVEEQLTNLKLKFFTNISHELRTPLTLIVGPLEHLLKRDNLSADQREQLGIVSNNASKMLRLVNQILDFQKIQHGKMQLMVEQVDLVTLVGKQVSDFSLLAKTMQIGLHYEHRAEHLYAWVDAEKVGQIVSNLLSNAFKYSQVGRPINVTVDQSADSVILSVQDYGVGLTSDKLKRLFERFGSHERRTPSGQESSGIGLSLTKELVELHHGTITVNSQEGVGTCFKVSLPLGREHFGPGTEFILNDSDSPSTPQTEASIMAPPQPASDQPASDPEPTRATLLVVEDNDELRRFIVQAFSADYQVLEARDGREGLTVVQQQMPDLVISDVMMPELDGFGLAEAVRQQPELSHIPIILLTALADTDNKLHGLRTGIDDYITKPFSASYLQARVENILSKRRLLQQYYQQRFASVIAPSVEPKQQKPMAVDHELSAPPVQLTPADSMFVERMTRCFQSHLADADFSVVDMAAEAHMSRSAFCKKFKDLLGQPPADMLRDLRMQRAAELIQTGTMGVAQVCYEVGYTDPHYFGKCFKAYYGLTATEWKDAHSGT